RLFLCSLPASPALRASPTRRSSDLAQMWPADNTIAEVYYTQHLSTTDRQLYDLVEQLNGSVFVAETSSAVLQAMSDAEVHQNIIDRKSTRLNSSHVSTLDAAFCLK